MLNGITGMLLYIERSFFQVLEGEADTVDRVFETIRTDRRHGSVTIISREAIRMRSFGDWTMGFADLSATDLDGIVGMNDFFASGRSFREIGHGRARKILAAFQAGRWRSNLSGPSPSRLPGLPEPIQAEFHSSRLLYTFAFQPIIHASTRCVFSQEALIRGPDNESAYLVLQRIAPQQLHEFHQQVRIDSLRMAAAHGPFSRININFLPSGLAGSPAAITSLLEAADTCGVRYDQIMLEILESEMITDYKQFIAALEPFRRSGVLFALDDFGAGFACLNQLAEFQPDYVKLDMHLVRGIDTHGPRQAIVRGIIRTCDDLGIELIAEGVETPEEYRWFRNEGIELFQGYLFARPAFETLSDEFFLPEN